MHKYTVIIDPNVNDEVFGNDNPFNLKKDLKTCKSKYKLQEVDLARYIADEIINDPNPPKHCKICEFNYSGLRKLRMPDTKNKKGSSFGFRIIVLVDFINNYAILLHIYNKIDKKDLSGIEKNKIKELNKKYDEALNDNVN